CALAPKVTARKRKNTIPFFISLRLDFYNGKVGSFPVRRFLRLTKLVGFYWWPQREGFTPRRKEKKTQKIFYVAFSSKCLSFAMLPYNLRPGVRISWRILECQGCRLFNI